jgi:3-oxoadipate enol-lactonase
VPGVPPATEGLPETRPDVEVDLLPALFRGAASTDLPSPEAVATIGVPTTLLAWIDDPAHPLSTAEALLELLPAARLEVASTRADVESWPAILRADVARQS